MGRAIRAVIFAAVIMAMSFNAVGVASATEGEVLAPVVECERYGCLYGHHPSHYTRGGDGEIKYGIAHEALAEGGPDRRFFERVLWPHRYDPARRAAWDRLAMCESTGNWHINTGNGYYGGVQFSLSSWRAAGGAQYAAYPHQAWPAQQIATAEVLLNMQGRGAWPGCLAKGQGAPYPQ